MTVETWLKENIWTADCRGTMHVTVRQLFGCDAHHLSFLYFLFYIHAAGGMEKLVEVRLWDRDSWSMF